MKLITRLLACSVLSAAGAVAIAAIEPAHALPPLADADINGKTVYLSPGSWLRYSDALFSRVYTTTKATLELKGRGRCQARVCPVTHNGIDLWALRSRLDEALASGVTPVKERTLRRGDEGPDVKLLQEALVKSGYALKVDSKYGAETVRAVEQVQRKANLPVDGAVGPQTRIALKL